jgi:hypothetical protein
VLAHGKGLLTRVTGLLAHAEGLLTHATRVLAHVTRLLAHATRLLTHIPRLLMHITGPLLHVSRPLIHTKCVLIHVTGLLMHSKAPFATAGKAQNIYSTASTRTVLPLKMASFPARSPFSATATGAAAETAKTSVPSSLPALMLM